MFYKILRRQIVSFGPGNWASRVVLFFSKTLQNWTRLKAFFNLFLAMRDFSIFFTKGSPSICLMICDRMEEKSQRAPFTVFGIVRNFKMNNFCLKMRFSEAQHAISEFFLKTGVFSMLLFSNFFSSKPTPLNFYLKCNVLQT